MLGQGQNLKIHTYIMKLHPLMFKISSSAWVHTRLLYSRVIKCWPSFEVSLENSLSLKLCDILSGGCGWYMKCQQQVSASPINFLKPRALRTPTKSPACPVLQLKSWNSSTAQAVKFTRGNAGGSNTSSTFPHNHSSYIPAFYVASHQHKLIINPKSG